MNRIDIVFAKLKRLFTKAPHQYKEDSIAFLQCPSCGKELEIISSRMCYGDDLVCKCNHCQYTITYPGTTILSND